MPTLKNAKILISGGAGFIGSHLARRLVAAGAKVFVMERKQTSLWRLKDVKRKVVMRFGDVAEFRDVLAVVKKTRPDVIFNLAGARSIVGDVSSLEANVNTNLHGVLNFYKAVKQLRHPLQSFVQAGSLSEYGILPAPYAEDERELPASPYSASKVAATHFCQTLFRAEGFPAIVLRPCLTYGPAQSTDMFIPMLIQQCLQNKDVPMTDGQQSRDFGYAADVAEAYVLAATHPAALGEVINISSGREYKVADVAKKIVALSGSRSKLLLGKLPQRPAEIMHMAGKNRKAKKLLGWSPKTDLEKGLKKTIEWYKNNLKIKRFKN